MIAVLFVGLLTDAVVRKYFYKSFYLSNQCGIGEA